MAYIVGKDEEGIWVIGCGDKERLERNLGVYRDISGMEVELVDIVEGNESGVIDIREGFTRQANNLG